jgi:activator of HSP90 ATPase
MSDKLKMVIILKATPEAIYRAWLDSKQHAAFTGSPAKIDPRVGGKFSAWDGYITGTTLELEPFKRIVQAWRTTEFPEDAPDSHLEVLLDPDSKNTRLTLLRTNIPEGQGEQYSQGWLDFYFEPMKEYFK